LEPNLLKHPNDINNLKPAICICIISAILLIVYSWDVSEGFIPKQLQINLSNRISKFFEMSEFFDRIWVTLMEKNIEGNIEVPNRDLTSLKPRSRQFVFAVF
jgi:hypothetical protein